MKRSFLSVLTLAAAVALIPFTRPSAATIPGEGAAGRPVAVSTYAGTGVEGSQDGFRTEATLRSAGPITRGPDGRIYFAQASIPDWDAAGLGQSIRVIDAAGIVTTYAGSDEPGLVDGPRLTARFRGPNGIVFDRSGNMFVSDRLNHRIRKIDPAGNVTTFAGSSAGYRDGVGSEAQFYWPIGICIDPDDNLYVADFENIVVRKVTPQGVVSTFAGIPGMRGGSDGPRTAATFHSPNGLAMTLEGELLVADWINGAIRKIDAAGMVHTIISGLGFVEAVAVDSQGSIYVSIPPGAGAHAFVKYTPAGDLLWSIGNPVGFRDGPISEAQFERYSQPLFLPGGNILMGDGTRIRMIEVEGGSCASVPSGLAAWWPGDGDSLDALGVNSGVLREGAGFGAGHVGQAFALDGLDDHVRVGASPALDVGQGPGFTIEAWINPRDLQRQQPIVEWNSGQAYGAHFYLSVITPHGTGPGSLFANILDLDGNNRVITSPAGLVKAGEFQHVALTFDQQTGNATIYLNGLVVAEQNLGSFTPQTSYDLLLGYRPPGFDGSPFAFAGNLDEVSLYSRPLTAAEIAAIQAIGSGGKCKPPLAPEGRLYPLVSTWAGSGSAGYGDGTRLMARFNSPNGGAIRGERFFVADTLNHRIRQIDIATGHVTTSAGAGTAGFVDGPPQAALFDSPLGTVLDPSGSVLIADTENNRIRRIHRDSGTVTTIAGSGERGYLDGPAAEARFDFPNDLVADAAGNVYVTEFNNHTIRKISPEGIVTTLAGSGTPGFSDGSGLSAGFYHPSGLAIDGAGTLYVTEWGSHRIRRVTAAGQVTTIAGSVFPGMLDGHGLQARFYRPDGIAMDVYGALYVTEHGNHSVRRIAPDGTVTTIAGNGAPGLVDGPGAMARFNSPGGVAIHSGGTLLITDTGNHCVRMIRFLAPPQVELAGPSGAVLAGSRVELIAKATGSGPFTYQWTHDGNQIPGATHAGLILHNVQVADAGNYSVLVSNPAGGIGSATATLAVAVPITFKRALPPYYSPGMKMSVRLESVPPEGSTDRYGYAVEDYPPEGWSIGSISQGGGYDAANRKVKFGPFFDTTPRVFTYELTPPTGESGPKYFSGNTSVDGIDFVIGGANEVLPAPLHPADSRPADHRISVGELTAYGTAWRKGESWDAGPNPIPVDFVTRAGLLWKNGELYGWDANVGHPPLWWVTSPLIRAIGVQSLSTDAPIHALSSAVRVVPQAVLPREPFAVRLTVKPAEAIAVYAVEEQVPAGSTVSSVSDGGELDSINQLVKWGPFFDNAPRELTYQVQIPSAELALITFRGVISLDGASSAIGGQDSARTAIRLNGFKRLSDAEVALSVGEADGQAYLIETSHDLRSWTGLTTGINLDGTLRFEDPEGLALPQRFYRAVRAEP